MKYTVLFELGGHKMKKQVSANNKYHAQALVADSIIFHGTELIPEVKEPTKPINNDDFNGLFASIFKGFKI